MASHVAGRGKGGAALSSRMCEYVDALDMPFGCKVAPAGATLGAGRGAGASSSKKVSTAGGTSSTADASSSTSEF